MALKNEDPALLFILGGPISVYEEDRYPFLRQELKLIEQRLRVKRPIFGICLGAQLLAYALGARVFPGREKEIGFSPLTPTEAGERSCLGALKDAPVLHWHGDTFDLPSGSRHLASTAICQNQAFSYEDFAMAAQFHPEAGDGHFERWLIGHTLELSMGKIDVNALRAEGERLAPGLSTRASECIKQWLVQISICSG